MNCGVSHLFALCFHRLVRICICMTVNQYDLSLKVDVHRCVNFVYVKVDFPRGDSHMEQTGMLVGSFEFNL